jgi:glycosyltransferase involved in cell wall biosynthesis
MKILHLQRRPQAVHFSIEGYFRRLREQLSAEFSAEPVVLPWDSRGFFRRLGNMLFVLRRRPYFCHITGDVHYVALALSRRRTILTVHDCEILQRLSGWRRAIVRLLWYTLPVKFVSAITVNSEETKRQLLSVVRFPPERIHVIPVSVSPLYRPYPRAFNVDCPRILQVGTKANKNVQRLIQALRGIKCHLDIVGPVDDSLRQQLTDCNISWTGWGRLSDEQLLERYCEADIVAFVSTHEGFGMPIVEAQWVERVCITSNCSSMPEVAGQGACLVNPHDVDAIQAGIKTIIEDPAYRQQLLDAGRANRRRFDSAGIAREFERIYRQTEANSTAG